MPAQRREIQLVRWEAETPNQRAELANHGIWWRLIYKDVSTSTAYYHILSQDKTESRVIPSRQVVEVVTPNDAWREAYEYEI
jgi:hypothetical protein